MDAVTCFIVIARIIHYFLKCEINMQALPSILGSIHLKVISSMCGSISKGELQIVKVGIHRLPEIIGTCFCCYFGSIAIVISNNNRNGGGWANLHFVPFL